MATSCLHFFDPKSVSAGASSAIYGLIGAQTVDLLQSWELLENKRLRNHKHVFEGFCMMVLDAYTVTHSSWLPLQDTVGEAVIRDHVSALHWDAALD